MGGGGFINNFACFEGGHELAPVGDPCIYRSIDLSIDASMDLSIWPHLSICAIHISTYLLIYLSSLSRPASPA